jgi:hypothetical protein
MTYGFHLWFFKGTCVKGLVKAMSQVQYTAVRWITGNFRTAPGGSGECLGELLPMHLLLQQQADWGALRITQLAPSHPLRPILGEALGGCHWAHRLGLVPSGVLSVTSLKGPLVDAAMGAGALLRDEVKPFCPDSFPGSHMVDLFQPRIHTHATLSHKDEEVAKYKTSLDVAWASACGDEACCMVAADASVPSSTVFQAAAAALIFRWGQQEARIVSAAGRCMPPEVEHFALQLGISAALAKGCLCFLFFLNQKFIMQGSAAVHRWHIQTIRKLRLYYALTVMYYQNLDVISGRQTQASLQVSMDDVALSSGVCSQALTTGPMPNCDTPLDCPHRVPQPEPNTRSGQSPDGINSL